MHYLSSWYIITVLCQGICLVQGQLAMRLENRWVLQHSWRSKVPRAWSCPYAALPWPADESKALWNLSHIKESIGPQKPKSRIIWIHLTQQIMTIRIRKSSYTLWPYHLKRDLPHWCVTHSFECFPRISSWNCHIQQVRSPAGFQLRWQSPRMSARIGSKS